MSTYPQLILPMGVTWKYKKTAKFNNIRQNPQSGRHPAIATLQYGTLFEFDLNWSYLKQRGVTTANDIQYLQEFYEAMRGCYGLFIFDPSFRNLENLSVTKDVYQLQNGFSGQTDGTSVDYPLWRSTNVSGSGLVTLLERVQNVTGLYGLTLNGTQVPWANFTQSNFPAVVHFSTPPAAGQTLVWQGTYNYLCQFAQDTQDFNEFMYQLWDLDSLKLETINL